MPSHYPKVTPNYRANDDKPCIECGAFEGPGMSYPHCTKCHIERLEWLLNPESGYPQSSGSADMMRVELAELRRVKQ